MHAGPAGSSAASCTHPAAGDGGAAARLLDALPVAAFQVDGDGRITLANQAAREYWRDGAPASMAAWRERAHFRRSDGSELSLDDLPPMRAARERRPVAPVELWADGTDGARHRIALAAAPVHDAAGTLAGIVATVTVLGTAAVADATAARLAAIVESSDDAIISKDFNGIIRTWNAAAERLFGYKAEEIIGRPITVLIPESRHDEEPEIIARIRRGERVEHYDTVRRRKDGSLIELSITVSPVRTPDGRIVGASKIARDITARRRIEDQRRLLLREMNHRVKNLFAVAAGVVVLSARSAASPLEMADAVRRRLLALTRAHELTRAEIGEDGIVEERATTLADLLTTIFAPYAEAERAGGGRLAISGPEVVIGSAAITSVALVLHEFATNSAKYGALLAATGRIEVSWRVEGERVVIAWSEHGGPAVQGSPQSQGFGTVLVDRTVTLTLGGRLDYAWRPDGVDIRLDLPVARLCEQPPRSGR
jgi:PAS domain S-box-containing protein